MGGDRRRRRGAFCRAALVGHGKGQRLKHGRQLFGGRIVQLDNPDIVPGRFGGVEFSRDLNGARHGRAIAANDD